MIDERFMRQILMEDIGKEGQEKIKKTKALVIGTGGLGSPVIYYLVAAGIGTIGLVDCDVVELSNLNRQILHFEDDINKRKVDSAEEKINRLNSNLKINKHHLEISDKNIDSIIENYDVVIDCVDNIKTRYIVNQSCINNKVPLVEGGVMELEGFIMTIIPDKSACFKCVYPDISDSVGPKPIPILGATAGVIGSMQVIEAIKIIVESKDILTNKMLFIDLKAMSVDKIEITRNESCEACSI